MKCHSSCPRLSPSPSFSTPFNLINLPLSRFIYSSPLFSNSLSLSFVGLQVVIKIFFTGRLIVKSTINRSRKSGLISVHNHFFCCRCFLLQFVALRELATMAEEQKWQEQGSHTLCANNCGFFGSPTTLNMCSKCYKDHCLKEPQVKNAQLAVEKTLAQAKSSSIDSSSSSSPAEIEFHSTGVESNKAAVEVRDVAAQPNRCATCRRRVGITGFKCRCGVTFCGTHRYPEQHGCTFDYKAMGRAAIAKANPVVKAEKLDKI